MAEKPQIKHFEPHAIKADTLTKQPEKATELVSAIERLEATIRTPLETRNFKPQQPKKSTSIPFLLDLKVDKPPNFSLSQETPVAKKPTQAS